jgi:16S rRNA (uracil1498-N3)-methyltransferase
MKRFILTSGPDKNGLIKLSGDDYHYLVRVRRLAAGEYFPALLPSGEAVTVQVRSVDGGILAGGIAQEVVTGAEMAQIPLMLFQALPKGEKMDLIVRQAAESAVTEIVPFASEFSIAKIDEAHNEKKVSRWERIIKEARQQSGSVIPTTVRRPLSLNGLFAYWDEMKQKRPQTLGLLFHHLPLAKVSLHDYLNNKPDAVAIAIGPEGGFSQAEAARFLDAGFKPFTIGDTILRTETAALYAAAAVRIILQERNSWETKQAAP